MAEQTVAAVQSPTRRDVDDRREPQRLAAGTQLPAQDAGIEGELAVRGRLEGKRCRACHRWLRTGAVGGSRPEQREQETDQPGEDEISARGIHGSAVEWWIHWSWDPA